MELRDIKALVLLMREHGLLELEIEDKKGKVRLVRGTAAGSDDKPSSAAASRLIARTEPAPAAAPGVPAKKNDGSASKGNAGASGGIDLKPNQKLVVSPMVGTFYRAAAANAAPFVEEGDTVRKGQALCIIEAMKMMNEIEAEIGGKLLKILCENGQPVEYGQPLMIIEAG